ncbi:MAG: hypothetical protein A3G81_30785 [Betaproteobacteria bacterium RIFCSPLOWO2_12_FULL_65_14]|nr:MAG: hypothetical protein A3G81_30785 [Betaproteobacteria bacterium RIFCSPLOWO2_12_FULL_65_14]
MKLRNTVIAAFSLAALLGWAAPAQAHCDTLDGPVVSAARQALDTGNVNLALVWVQARDEAELKRAFDKASAARKAGGAAKELADSYFFETLVRVHRAGEGAPYTGLKPAGQIEPPIAAADKALASGQLQPVGKLITQRVEQGLHKEFDAAMAKKSYRPDDVAAGRAFVNAYVEYVHYVEKLYDAAGSAAPAQHAH